MGIQVVIYEPELDSNAIFESKVISDLDDFKKMCDVIVANRKADCLKDVQAKCFSRDLLEWRSGGDLVEKKQANHNYNLLTEKGILM